jgi:hypothetical protein
MEIDNKGEKVVQRYEYGGEIEDKRWTWTKREQQ